MQVNEEWLMLCNAPVPVTTEGLVEIDLVELYLLSLDEIDKCNLRLNAVREYQKEMKRIYSNPDSLNYKPVEK